MPGVFTQRANGRRLDAWDSHLAQVSPSAAKMAADVDGMLAAWPAVVAGLDAETAQATGLEAQAAATAVLGPAIGNVARALAGGCDVLAPRDANGARVEANHLATLDSLLAQVRAAAAVRIAELVAPPVEGE